MENEEMKNETPVNNQEEMATLDKTVEYKPLESGKKKNMGVIIAGVVLAIIAIGALVWFFVFKDASTNAYEKYAKEFFAEIKNNLNEVKNSTINYDFASDAIAIEGNASISSDMAELGILSDYTLNFATKMDAKNDKYEVTLGLDNATTNILEGTAYIVDGEGYLASEKLFDGLFYMPLESTIDLSAMPAYDIDTYLKIVSKVESIVLNYIKESTITKEKTTYDGESVTDHIFVLDSANAKRLLNDFADSLLNDEEILEDLARTFSLDVTELKTTLESIKNTEFSDDDNGVTFHLYMKGNELMAMTLVQEEVEVLKGTFSETENVITFDDGNYTITYNDNDFKFSGVSNNEPVSLSVHKESANKSVIEMEGDDTKVSLTTEISKESESKMNTNFVMDIETVQSGEEIAMSITFDGFMTVGDVAVADIDPSTAKDINDLSEEEAAEIMMNLLDALKADEVLYDLFTNYVL